MSTAQRRLCAIMFSDMTGYSRMMGKNEEGTLALVEEMTSLMTRFIGEHRGNVLKFIGDAVLATFDSAYDAVFCAVAVQHALTERNLTKPVDEQILIRIGIHTGDIVLKDGDVFGDGVNIAARLEPQAKPGGICISQAVYDAVRASPAIRTISLGRRKLKNIQEAIPIYHVLTDMGDHASSNFITRLTAWRQRYFFRTLTVLALLVAAVWGWRQWSQIKATHLTTFTIVLTDFPGDTTQATEDGKVIGALIRHRINDVLGRDRYINILGDKIKEAPRTHAQASELGLTFGADIVIWGEVLAFGNEIEFKPNITALDPVWNYPPIELPTFHANINEADPLSHLENEAHEIGNLTLLAAAKFYRYKKIYDRALSLLQKIKPSTADSLITQAWIHFSLNQRDLMMEDFRSAVALDPKALYPRQMLAFSQLFLGDSDKAIRDLKVLQKEDPQNPKTYQLLGAIYVAQGKLSDAIDYSKKALERDPHDKYIYADLGKIYCRQGNFTEAARIYRAWVRMYPSDPHANMLAYLMARRAGQASIAETRYQEFFKQLPPANLALDSSWPAAVTYFFAGKMNEADLLKSITGTNLSALPRRQMEGYYYLGMAHLLNTQEPDHVEKARDYFEKCVATGLQNNQYFLAQIELARMKTAKP